MDDWSLISKGIGGILQTKPLLLMIIAVVASSIFAALPGVGSSTLLAMSLPIAMTMQPYEVIALLFGITIISNTANTFPSVLIAVPGGSGSQATIIDGHPMARKGEAKRAFGAAYMASLMGGLIGGVVFFLSLPIVSPLVLLLGSPELLMLVLWGLSAVGILSGNAPVKGLMAAAFGLAVSLIGTEARTGVERFTFEGYYLWDGVHIALVGLGLFAVPELIDLSVRRSTISDTGKLGSGLMQGVRDAWKNWWLVTRCSIVGVWIGILPGLGSSVADWFAYAHAAQTEKNTENFGKGDVRGVIAPESSNNAKEGGALIPTMFFGIPGSTSMALVLVTFAAVGISPGEAMITTNKHLIYSMLTVIVLANFLATGLSMGLAGTFAKVSVMPFYVVVPMTLIFTIAAAYGVKSTYQDLATLVVFAFIGFYMRRYGWPRPPVLVAVVLGPQIQTYLWLSMDRYSFDWMLTPGVMIIAVIIVMTVFFPMWRNRKKAKVDMDYYMEEDQPRAQSVGGVVFTLIFLGVLVYGVTEAVKWPIRAAMDVYFITGIGICLAGLQLTLDFVRYRRDPGAFAPPVQSSNLTRLYLEAAGWIAGILAGIFLIGFHISFFLVPILYVRVYGGSWRLALILGLMAEGILIGLFDTVISVVWQKPILLPFLYDW
ncbi:MAG: tripartite tricarboxylate transporter permease [Rhodospirillales bacterium]|jgi:TctA family transporter|nr:tripartite tricarboxylate transporter permease [Rhodospirillales bacterium]MBT4007251.1 tripartite tricarboxylate transporter permease [Rhodospirillales bacterium]MBT5076864.1 tripartite tricarboxylate transporter permease [Rhodospirillales bacterium]MBT5113584.1 tripartite tricarboxylate transporter permease [Rhodospirillales bacterium]MBT5673882.1 tripartite tricarboxylate transporter permease [Rhodospirillales bacterium]